MKNKKNKNHNKINIYFEFNKKLFINYLTKIASYILKIKNTNDIIFLKKTKNIYELFYNHNNYLTAEIFIDYELEKLKLNIFYKNIKYYYFFENYRLLYDKIKIEKLINNISISYVIPTYYNENILFIEYYKYKTFQKTNNNIILKIYHDNYENYIIYHFKNCKYYKKIIKLYIISNYFNFNSVQYDYNYKIYIKITKRGDNYINNQNNIFFKYNYISQNTRILNII